MTKRVCLINNSKRVIPLLFLLFVLQFANKIHNRLQYFGHHKQIFECAILESPYNSVSFLNVNRKIY